MEALRYGTWKEKLAALGRWASYPLPTQEEMDALADCPLPAQEAALLADLLKNLSICPIKTNEPPSLEGE